MRVLMTGGGTGGHINPAIAIANTIKLNEPGAEIAFVGTKHGKETELVPRAGYPLYFVEIQGVRRSLSLANIKTAWYVLTAPRKAAKLIEEFRPDIVIGTGGYACWPTLRAAAKLGIPTIVHESNALPGLAVRKLSGKVDRILINFEETRNLLGIQGGKVVRVGNPVRAGFGAITQSNAKRKLNIDPNKYFVMSVGGSLGADVLNQNALELMKVCAATRTDIIYMHAAGTRYYNEFREKMKLAGLDLAPNIHICDYIHDMPLRMAAADIVISRSGAVTLSELAMMNKAAVLVPSPNVVDNHQYKNAKVLADAEAALLLEESEMAGGGKFTETVLELIDNDDKRAALSKNIAKFADVDANKIIFSEIKKLLCEHEGRKNPDR